MNLAIIIGNVGADPEIKSFQDGGKIANLRIATSERWKDKSTGEKKERTEWHSIVVKSEGLVGVVERFVKKGSKLAVKGKIQTRKWQDRDGNDRYSTEIVLQGFDATLELLSSAEGSASSGASRQQSGGNDWGGSSSGSGPLADDLDDEVPF
ncbi:Ssb Single-stranded DNA-binding protein [uncultured Caudovirales phage]|uniref:Single-stranded DNA-binding protein n=1 Tax=uncultured Caudovirales phage TaxID=2100421 RepID=A0A6J5LZW6_9CAUD|nr:Ssb Single-stranded DNA-binding protein [uncultured Caudovirales phage]